MNAKNPNPKWKNSNAANKKKTDKQKPDERKYDLEERTAVFGERIIDFVKTLPINVINKELIRQLVKARTSVGANNTKLIVRSPRRTSEPGYSYATG